MAKHDCPTRVDAGSSLANPRIKISSLIQTLPRIPPMAFAIYTSTLPHLVSRATLFSHLPLSSNEYHPFTLRKPLRAQLSSKNGNNDHESARRNRKNRILAGDDDGGGGIVNVWEEIEFAEVFGIGSRKDAVLDFCMNSPFLSPALRFWNIVVKDEANIQLQERFSKQDMTPRIVEATTDLQLCSKVVILVASAAYGSDDIAALNILRTIKSANGLVVGIVLKPFSFEGRRRQDEMNNLVGKIQNHANFFIVVDTDALLEKDLVTLDEALKTSNNAVLMAINAISILISEENRKLLEVAPNGVKEVNTPELRKILESYREAKIGFGVGCNIKTSVLRAVYDCPFFGGGVKDFNGTIICVVASSGTTNTNDANTILHNVRLTIGCKREVIVSIVNESNLKPNSVATTIMAFGNSGQLSSQKNGIFSRLAKHFPFIFNILKTQYPKPHSNKESYVSESPCVSEEIFSQDHDEMPDKTSLESTSKVLGVNTNELEPLLSDSAEAISSLRHYESNSEQNDTEFAESDSYPFSYLQNAKGVPNFKEELLTRYRLGPDNLNTEDWTKEGDANTEATVALDRVNIYRLPVGIKHLGHLNDFSEYPKHQKKWRMEDYRGGQSDATPSVSQNGVSDRDSEATMDSDRISTSKVGSYAGDSSKQGVLSVRAASMLEAERDSQKKWNPVVEMKYRGGVYRGRIQGGLPEGKGRLSLGDGSIYDGMWRYGKRSGLGTFYFNNGDVFQGSWRDDAMHGKGWFYFHTGDRWFVNLWKGKANGEGRFYSKLGDVFFGQFKDGWRHGHFLCVSVDGARCHEVWDEGVLVSREQLDPDADAA